MAGATTRKMDCGPNTPSKGGDPDDNGSENKGKGKPSKGGKAPSRTGASVGNSAHGRWK